MLMRYLLLLVVPLAAPVHADPEVERLLAGDEMPVGVVFEIVEGDEDALAAVLPRVRQAIAQLRARFPEIELAVVSHGGEQFALQSKYRQEYAGIHQEVDSLTRDQVPVHVCGTHASWFDVMPEDFPDYVDVAPAAPAQIAHYEELGYELIVLP